MQDRILRYTRRAAIAVWVVVGLAYIGAPASEVSAAAATRCADVCSACTALPCAICAVIGDATCMQDRVAPAPAPVPESGS